MDKEKDTKMSESEEANTQKVAKEENREQEKTQKPVKEENREQEKTQKPVKEENKEQTKIKDTAKVETKVQETPKNVQKKFEKTKSANKNTKIGIIAGVIIVVIAILAILACVFLLGNSPKSSLETILNSLKSGNYNDSMLTSLLEEENFNQEAQKLLFDKLQWKVIKVKEDGNKATVEVELTNKDFKTIINNYMQKVVKIAFSGKTPSDEEITNYLIEELNNNQVQTVTSNQIIELEKKDGKWEIANENDFVVAVLPGFNEAINSFNN